MHTASSAKRTWSAVASAVECTATVRTPSSRQARMTRRAISPRLAMRIFLNISDRLDAEQRLPELHRLPVLDQDLGDLPRLVGLDLVHQLHRLNDAEDLALLHHRAHLDEGRLIRRGRAVEGADEGRVDQVALLVAGSSSGRCRGSLGR